MKTTAKRGYKKLELTDKPDLTLYGESLDKVDADVDGLYSEMEAKANGKWSIYTSLLELGLNASTVTIEQICETLPPNSEISIVVDSMPNLMTPTIGTLKIIKRDLSRTFLHFYHHTMAMEYIGNYHLLNVPKFSGWFLVSRQEDILSTAVGKGASIQGIADIGNYFVGTTTEAALQELGKNKIISRSVTVDCAADTWATVPGFGGWYNGRKGALLVMIGKEHENGIGAAIYALVKNNWSNNAVKVKLASVAHDSTLNEFDVQWINDGLLQIKSPSAVSSVNVTLVYSGL